LPTQRRYIASVGACYSVNYSQSGQQNWSCSSLLLPNTSEQSISHHWRHSIHTTIRWDVNTTTFFRSGLVCNSPAAGCRRWHQPALSDWSSELGELGEAWRMSLK